MYQRAAAAKARTVAKHHKHVKPAAAHHKAATGHAHKHHKAAKHHAKPHKHKGTVHRGLAPAADQVACCAAEALAASLRLSGLSVADADVLDLFWRAGGDPEAGVPILAVLEAAAESGLAARRPVSRGVTAGVAEDFYARFVNLADVPGCAAAAQAPEADALQFFGGSLDHSLILGVDLPGPHTVLATPEGWWSWGELHCPCEWPDAVIEEAWVISWR